MTGPENPDTTYEFMPETPELSPELQVTFEQKRSDIRYPIVCGDDREQTRESQEVLKSAGIEQTDAQIRYFGGAAGLERVLGVTLIASGQADRLTELGETVTDAIKAVKRDIEASSNVTLELHSAEGSEGNAAEFDPRSAQAVGCAYAASEAVVATICAEDENHHALTIEETSRLFGAAPFTDEIRSANQKYKDIRFGNGASGLSRAEFKEIGAPVQILSGQHAHTDETFVAINFMPDRVSNPSKAHELGQPFYNNDVTQVAEMLIRTYPQFNLDPELLLAVMDQDIRATRAALAHGEPEGAAALEVRRLGSPAEAIAFLRALS